MKKKLPLESSIERKYVSWCAEQGLLQTKLQKNGWPDRQIFLGIGYSFFIEFKRPGEKPSALQLWVHQLLKEKGYNVYVCDNVEEAIRLTKAEIQAKEAPRPRHQVPGIKTPGNSRRRARRREDHDGAHCLSEVEEAGPG